MEGVGHHLLSRHGITFPFHFSNHWPNVLSLIIQIWRNRGFLFCLFVVFFCFLFFFCNFCLLMCKMLKEISALWNLKRSIKCSKKPKWKGTQPLWSCRMGSRRKRYQWRFLQAWRPSRQPSRSTSECHRLSLRTLSLSIYSETHDDAVCKQALCCVSM